LNIWADPHGLVRAFPGLIIFEDVAAQKSQFLRFLQE